MSTEIRYNGSVIASVEPGKTKILECAGEKMKSNVAVKASEPILQEKNATENGEVTPDEGYDGLSKVTVDVPIPAGYIAPEGTLTITAAGTYDVSGYVTVVVEI